MAKNFNELRKRMSPDRLARSEERVKKMLAEMPLHELSEARRLTQEQLVEQLGVAQGEVSTMYDYAVATTPFEDVFVEELHGLAQRVFGSVQRSELDWKLSRMPDVSVHFARTNSMVGFKIGYAVGPTSYRSWLGGVDSDHRGRGVALHMTEEQHSWAREHGYTSIETSLVPANLEMLALNLRVGFQIIGMYTRDEMPRVTLLKRF